MSNPKHCPEDSPGLQRYNTRKDRTPIHTCACRCYAFQGSSASRSPHSFWSCSEQLEATSRRGRVDRKPRGAPFPFLGRLQTGLSVLCCPLQVIQLLLTPLISSMTQTSSIPSCKKDTSTVPALLLCLCIKWGRKILR